MSAMRLAATAVKIAPQCNIRHTACGALAVSGRVEVKKSCAVGDVSSTSTVSQCRADDVAAAAAPSSVPDRDGTSPGIFGQTASPPPVPASGQKAGPSLEALARSADAALIEETSKPADGQDAARLEALRKEAVCAARAYLEQVNPSDRKSLAYASRLVGEAHGTTQLGLARRADHVALNKYSILFKMTKSLESRLKDPASNPLTGHERQAVDRAIEFSKRQRGAALRASIGSTGAASRDRQPLKRRRQFARPAFLTFDVSNVTTGCAARDNASGRSVIRQPRIKPVPL